MSKADQAVLERRLRPIYDAIDLDNNKRAIQEADKVLKKHPTTICAKILKALALIRSERLAEGFAIIDAIDVPGAVHDDSTLQAFVHCFKEAALPGRICQLYERVVETSPTEQNLTQLFMSYVRVKKYKQQQQIGMRLFKEFGNPPYLCWAVMSIVMQATTEPVLAKKMFYPLAERMLVSHVQKFGYKSGADVDLHVIVLRGLEKFSEAEKLLGSDVAKALVSTPPQFLSHTRLRLLVDAHSYQLASERAIEALKSNNDDWNLWLILLDSTFGVLSDPEATEAQKKRASDEAVHAVTAHCGAAGKNRGPYLARLELLLRILNAQKPIQAILGTTLGEPMDLIMAYIRKFYTKPCCFADLEKYICLLNANQEGHFLSQMANFVSELSTTVDINPESICRAIIVYERVKRKLGCFVNATKEELQVAAQNIMQGLKKPSRTDLSGGELSLLTAQLFWQDWQKNDNSQLFFNMILLLEWTATKFPSDPYSKLILCRAYSHIGVLHRVNNLCKALDIKAVQKDTLGHFLFPMFELCGRFNLGLVHYTELTNMYSQAEREIYECLIGGYKNGAFAQVPGLIELDERLQFSSSAIGGDVMSRFISGMFVISDINEAVNTLYGDEEPIQWDKLVDNRDMTVIPSYDPECSKKLIEESKRQTHREFVDSIKLRHLLCRAIASLGRLSCSGAVIKDAVTLLRLHLEYCRTTYPENMQASRIMQSAAPVRLSAWAHDKSLTTALNFLEVGVDVVLAKETGRNVLNEMSLVPSEVLADMEAALPRIDFPKTCFNFHETLFNTSRCLQGLAIAQIIMVLIEKRGTLNATKGDLNLATFSEICWTHVCGTIRVAADLRELCERLIDHLEDTENGLFPEIGNWSEDVKDLVSASASTVKDRIRKSYEIAVEELIDFAHQVVEKKWV